MKPASRVALFLVLVGLVAVAAQAQIQNFKHIVVIVQENRTPDNLFQGLCSAPYGACAVPPTAIAPYDIQTSKWLTKGGKTLTPVPVTLAAPYGLGHSHSSFNAMCDMTTGNPPKCLMDGASGIPCGKPKGGSCPPNPQFSYVDNSTGLLKPYLTLASQYGWANYMFQTNQGPSYPAHQFIFGGTSATNPADDTNGIFQAENMTPVSNPGGCAAPAATRIVVISPSSTPPPLGVEKSLVFPCAEHQTMADLVPDWMYYTAAPNNIWNGPNGVNHICVPSGGACTGWGTHVATNPSQVLKDIGKCHLHDLTWVTPTAANSDHGETNTGGGPAWVASVVNAIGNSTCTDQINGKTLTFWEDTAIFITWDDWGGWYDHEPPPILPGVQGDYQYGFRVPMIVVSAYTKKGLVDNSRYDFGSLLRFIEFNYASVGLREGELGFADARSTTDFTAFFELTHTPRKFGTIPANKTAAYFINDRTPPEPPDQD